MDVKPYLVQEGLVFRLTSDRTEKGPAVNTKLTYKNLIESPDFSNLADAGVNFNYEDFHTRMIVPLRQSFNALAETYLKEGDTEMAEKVLMVSVEKLHYPHLPPSFTDLYTAEMLRVLGKDDVAKSISVPAFNYYYDQIQSSLQQNQSPDNFDVYILKQSTALLNTLGETSYVEKFGRLGL